MRAMRGVALTVALGACTGPVYFERGSDGARGHCDPGWTVRLRIASSNPALDRCISGHLREGFVRVLGPAGGGAGPRPPGGADPVATAVLPSGGSPAGPSPRSSAEESAAERERRMQAALLEAQLHSRMRSLAEQLTAEQRKRIVPGLEGLVELAVSGAAEAKFAAARKRLAGRARELRLSTETRDELDGVLRDAAALAATRGGWAAGR